MQSVRGAGACSGRKAWTMVAGETSMMFGSDVAGKAWESRRIQ